MSKLNLAIDVDSVLHTAIYGFGKEFSYNAGLIGFFCILHSCIRKHDPDYIHLCMDGKPNLRKIEYDPILESFGKPGYKSGRERHEDVDRQLSLTAEIATKINLPVYQVNGYEADDVVFSLTKVDWENQWIVVSGDNDLLYMASDRIFVSRKQKGHKIDPATGEVRPLGFTDYKLFAGEEFFDEFGYHPWQHPDVKGLGGDTSDKIPGVEGIGKGRATTLIREFTSLENVLDQAEAIADLYRWAKHLPTSREIARVSKEMAQLRLIDLDVKKTQWSPDTVWRIKEILVEKGRRHG